MRTLTLLALTLATGIAACDAPRDETSEEFGLDEVNTESREAVDNFRNDVRSRLGEIDARIQEIRVKADSTAGAAKTELASRVEEFQSRSGVIAQRLETLTWTDENSWDQMTDQVEKSLDSLRQDVDRALDKDQPAGTRRDQTPPRRDSL
jgi:hypothetical protein